jgi:hypothetical protein
LNDCNGELTDRKVALDGAAKNPKEKLVKESLKQILQG